MPVEFQHSNCGQIPGPEQVKEILRLAAGTVSRPGSTLGAKTILLMRAF